MAEITVSANKKLKTLNSEFQDNFPYLMLVFCSEEEWNKTRDDEGQSMEYLDMNLYIRDVRTTKPNDGQEMSIHGNTVVKKLEDNFLEFFGIYAQVCYRGPDGKGYYTSDELDTMTLSSLNSHLKEEGCQEYPTVQSDIDNSSVRTDQVTFACRILHESLEDKIQGLEPVLPSKHYSKGQSTFKFREYYADIEDDYLESFFIEWEPEGETLYVGFYVIAPARERKEFKKKFASLCSKEGIDSNEYACFIDFHDFHYDSFLAMDERIPDSVLKLYGMARNIRKSLD